MQIYIIWTFSWQSNYAYSTRINTRYVNFPPICKSYTHHSHLQIFTVAWDVVSENPWGLPQHSWPNGPGQKLRRSWSLGRLLFNRFAPIGLGGSCFRNVPLWGWQDIGVPHWAQPTPNFLVDMQRKLYEVPVPVIFHAFVHETWDIRGLNFNQPGLGPLCSLDWYVWGFLVSAPGDDLQWFSSHNRCHNLNQTLIPDAPWSL